MSSEIYFLIIMICGCSLLIMTRLLHIAFLKNDNIIRIIHAVFIACLFSGGVTLSILSIARQIEPEQYINYAIFLIILLIFDGYLIYYLDEKNKG